MPNKPYLRYPVFGALILSLFSCRPQTPRYDETDIQALHEWLDSQRTMPAELLAEEIAGGRRPMLVQDDVLRADTADLMRSLVPVIHDLGLNSIGVFFLDEADQDEIDRYIVSGDQAAQPESFLVGGNASLGYREYRDFIEYVREFNQQGSTERDVVRLVALSRDRISFLKDDETEGSFLWLTTDQIGRLPSMPPGDPAPMTILHYGLAAGELGWNGVVEAVGAGRAIRDMTFAFRPTEAAWAKPDDFPGVDMVVVTSFPYRTVEPIADFVTPETAEKAMKFFPDLRPRKPLGIAASRMNGIIRRSARRHKRKLDGLKKPTDS